MFERRHPWVLLVAFALLLAPFAVAVQPAQAAAKTYIVTDTHDYDGTCEARPAATSTCTLRQAINSADGDNVSSAINFFFSGSSNITITPENPLPELTKPDTVIVGQINVNNSKPRIIINGNGALPYGLSVGSGADNTTIEKLIFTGFTNMSSDPAGVAIYVNGASDTLIIGNYIGNIPDVAHIASHANRVGIYVRSGIDTIIGGAQFTDRNVISGNTSDGISFSGADGGSVLNNYIGVAPGVSNAFVLGNDNNGIQIANSTGVAIGGDPPNIISGNVNHGILVTGSLSNGNTISSNYIGTDENGLGDGGPTFGNGGDGVQVASDAKGTILSGSGVAAPTLLISNNAGYGVRVTTRASGTQVYSAIIGLNLPGLARLDNQLGGVALLDNSTTSTVGPNNYISGNAGAGVTIKLTSGSFTAVSSTTIKGNYIGLGVSLNTTISNDGPGIDVAAGSSGTIIGVSGAGNYIAGNQGDGIVIAGSSTTSTTVAHNVIGLVNTSASGSGTYTVSQANTANGILASGGATSTTISDNRIAGHTGGAGIRLSDVITATLSSNDIGYVDGVTPPERPNATGIALNNASAVDVLTNTIKYNTGSAIAVSGASQRIKVIENELRSNNNYGVLVGGTSQRVTIQSNYMTMNAPGGVRLEGTTKGLAAETDTASSPNHGIDPPIYDPLNDPTFVSPLRFMLDQNGYFAGYVYTDTGRISSCRLVTQCQIQLFAPKSDDSIGGQGFTPYQVTVNGSIGAFVSPDASGYFSGRLVLGSQKLPGQLIFAVTDGEGNTSESGVLNVTPKLEVTYIETADGRKDARPGDVVTYTLRLKNDGTIKLSNTVVVATNSLWSVTPQEDTINYRTLNDHSSQTFTVTLTLPTGSDTRVLEGTEDYTRLYAQATGKITTLTSYKIMTTTVLASPVLTSQTLTSSGSARPTETVTHTHRFTNSGNVTVTLDLQAKTIDPANSGYIWNPVTSVSSLLLPPGQSGTVNVMTAVPNGAPTVNPATGQPFIVTTLLTGTLRSPYSSITRVVSGTVGVKLAPSVLRYGGGITQQAASFAEVSFSHTFVNTSNGPADFCLNWRSYSGSSVQRFRSQNGVVINEDTGCFHLGTSPDTNRLSFEALIRVTGQLLPQQIDQVEIFLTNNDTEVANAKMVDYIEITVSPQIPQIWLPAIIL